MTEAPDVAAGPTRREPGAAPRPLVRVTSLGLYAGGFLFLMGAAAGAALSHFTASRIAPWLSIGYSGGAVAFTVAAIIMSRRR